VAERADEIAFALPVQLRGPAHVLGALSTALYAAEQIEAYAVDHDCPPGWTDKKRADLAAYEAVVAEAEEACGAAELHRRVAEVERVQAAVYGKILKTPATTFDGLAAHIRFLIDDLAYPDGEVELILAGLDNIRRGVDGCAVASEEVTGFGPR
jgi:hypothetical protein